MSYLFSNYQRKPYEIMSGNGCYLTDHTGKEYLDFTSGIGVCNLGYGNKKLNSALKKQAEKLWHTPNLYQNSLQEEVAEKLCQRFDYLAYFCNSGAEANEAAIKLARKKTGKTQIITFWQSFHGRTYGALSATGQKSIQAGFHPLVPDFVHLPFNELAPLQKAITKKTAAVMLEVVQGEGGVLPADKEWLQAVAKLCRENDCLLIVDEVQTGIGRCGSLFAFEDYAIYPDIVTLAKGLGNGFPVGAMLAKKELGASFLPGSHGSTFGGNKMAMVAAKTVLTELTDQNIYENVKMRSEELMTGLKKLNAPFIKSIRGKGLMIGIVLQEETNVTNLMLALETAGMLTLRAGENILRLLPPLIITSTEIIHGLHIFEKAFSKLSLQE
ncbi:acetylornithine transaminase [Enterococcus sp. SMC-9]|uniref:acetylornithine transaminase n=1 Tax=Enterococcus sp. SMC-9 TaxID=2862343 RepID=UPI001E641683|nr:acetylornithine transaminase [Enterococcus sp. SMC-9]MCD1024743.1 acetylornithine transaminase [Enterococcus sp. SMC-9]